jgi:hypothetical protein
MNNKIVEERRSGLLMEKFILTTGKDVQFGIATLDPSECNWDVAHGYQGGEIDYLIINLMDDRIVPKEIERKIIEVLPLSYVWRDRIYLPYEKCFYSPALSEVERAGYLKITHKEMEIDDALSYYINPTGWQWVYNLMALTINYIGKL